MKEHISLLAKIGGKTALKWVFILFTGVLLTLVFSLAVIYKNQDMPGTDGTIVAFIKALPSNNLAGAILLLGGPLFLMLYFLVANKTFVQNAIYLIWNNKGGDYIVSVIKRLIDKITQKEGPVKNITDAAMLRAKLLQANKEDATSPKLQRKIIGFAFQKIALDDIDFQEEDLELSDIIIEKFSHFVSEVSKPSMRWFWILVLLQMAMFIFSMSAF